MILVLGGARSGKSSFAERLAIEKSEKNVLYIATAIGFDSDMKDRIKKHIDNRPKEWITLEKFKYFSSLDSVEECDVVIVDCMTLMISNLLLESRYNFDSIDIKDVDELEKEIISEIENLIEIFENKHLIIVSNEVGLGLVPAYRLGAIFRDVAGRVNQIIAKKSSDVYFMCAGIESKIK